MTLTELEYPSFHGYMKVGADIIGNHTHFARSGQKMSEEEEAVPEQEEGEGEEEAEVLSPGSSGEGSLVAPDDIEEGLAKLASNLEVPLTTLQAMAESEDGMLLLSKVAEHLDEKENDIKEYEGALKELTLSITQQQAEQTCE